MTPILILAAGKSSRMRGRDKHLEEIDGVPLLRRLAMAALELGQPVFVALPTLPHPRAEALTGLNFTPLAIPEAAEGMSGTLRGAVARLPVGDGFLLVLGDLAEIGAKEMWAVLNARAARLDCLIWRGATESGDPGHPILFDGSLMPRFAELSGDGGGESLVNPLREETHLVPLPGRMARHDLDTPEDWEAFRKKTPQIGRAHV